MKINTQVFERPLIRNAKELVSLKIDSDILAHFQADGPGWQDRINDARLIGRTYSTPRGSKTDQLLVCNIWKPSVEGPLTLPWAAAASLETKWRTG